MTSTIPTTAEVNGPGESAALPPLHDAASEAKKSAAPAEKKSGGVVRKLRAVAAFFDAGKGSGQQTLQRTDQALLQGLNGGSELAKQAEASGQAYPPAPDPTVDWA